MVVSGSANRAHSAATIMSHIMASSQPPPIAWPDTAAIVGLRAEAMRSQVAVMNCSENTSIKNWFARSTGR